MTTKTNIRKDFVQLAHSIFQQASGEVSAKTFTSRQESGRKGGLAGGTARAEKLESSERSAIAKKAAQTRWAKK